jgi:pyrroloquinoline-quinone synthase
MYNLLQRIDLEIERSSLLKHKFYRLWSEGKLDMKQLKGYSLEYFQMVRAVPLLVENIMSCCTEDTSLKPALSENYKEELEHVDLWAKFTGSLGIKSNELVDYISSDATNDAIKFLIGVTKKSLGQGAAAMYAYEKQLPEISRSKIDGLVHFYDMGNNSKEGIEYFTVHEKVDVRHAALWKSIVENVSHDPPESLLQAAIDSLRAQNRLLDSVCERYITPVNS